MVFVISVKFPVQIYNISLTSQNKSGNNYSYCRPAKTERVSKKNPNFA